MVVSRNLPMLGRTSTLPQRRAAMSISEDGRLDRDAEGGEDADEDPGEELEAMIEQADRPFASDSFGTTAEEQEEGETLDQRLAEEEPSREALDVQVAIED